MEKSLTTKSAAVIEKSVVEEIDCSCLLNRFDNKIIFQILNKIIDLRTLCICKLVTKRVSSIVRLVDKISFTTPLVNPDPGGDISYIDHEIFEPKIRYAFQGGSFKLVKNLHVQIPSPSLNDDVNDCILMKWRLAFGNNPAVPYVFVLFVKSILQLLNLGIVGSFV